MRVPTVATDSHSPESDPTSLDSINAKPTTGATGTAAGTTGGATPSERQQCWECRRRRLVCDGAQPVCSKCRAAGIVCPGYADKKPLTWLAPGQVMSRTRRKKSPAGRANPKSQQSRGAVDRKVTVTQRPKARNNGTTGRAAENEGQVQDEGWFGRPVDLRPEVVDVFEAMMYYNLHIYPQIEQSLLGPSGFLVPMVLLEGVPPSITHTLVSVVISHRIIQTADDPTTCQMVKPLWTRLYRHRDIAVREITRLIGNEKTRTHAVTITAVYALLFAMLQQSFTPCWRTHIEAYVNLLRSWGSFSDIIRDVPYMQLSLMALFIANIFANSTSPRDDQFHSTSTAETLRLIQAYYSEMYYPSVACPTPLFTEIVLISDLRTGAPSPQTTRAAQRILARVQAFDAQAWGESHETFRDEWVLLGGLYREAVALYAILGFQSSGAFPGGEYVPRPRASHARRLFALLEEAVHVPRVKKRMTWPLVVAGVEAARAGREVQRWISSRLDELSRDQGGATPRVGKAVLERYWAKGGEGGWDGCFVEPLCLII
ncbi:fungal-specific transcription factor domain-containing protein [Dichotomopilus funicola]|uniref:Fungal-specific transcription factor domain-containing protein n=1 Tax=Dichotomopilus funicola TaxID=1934379 RepID=A0AAN6UVL8_9PEZI|nr:fungal-specific transcription factor domain-containing protein [Dichotomopilus funicola]